MLVDTHCHLDLPAFDDDRAAVIQRARAEGVDRFIVIGFEPERWPSTLALAESDEGIFASVGLHPTEAERYDDDLDRSLRDLARHPRVRAIGETGLDYHWETATPAAQREAFARQIQIAKDLGLPIVVHQRKASHDVLDVLRSSGPPHSGVMHCFTEDLDYARHCLDLGLHLGLGGALTYRSAAALHDAARYVPLDRVVLETDAPYMAPTPHRGQRNEPAYLALVARRLADLRGMSVEDVAAVTSDNADRLFRLSEGERLPMTTAPDGGARRVEVVIASNNRGKVEELRRLMPPWVDVLTAADAGVRLPEESGETFAENALLKARAAATQSGRISVADDSGLEVDALGGAPGVRSARFAGDPGDDAANNELLLMRLQGLPLESRRARFRSVVAVVTPDGREHVAEGVVEGIVLDHPRGTGGFGYDPLFQPLGYDRTMAQMTLDEKNEISHRGRAFRKAVRWLLPVLEQARESS